ncbi:hypothetical protein HUR95_15825 [Caldalkalibacillus thermarum TA2.A1]|uniref:Uncharacterized protein n=1 Tax=Caldalkalibacillus thermarum (strain TA2.A1) TaxID=986075 RepID=A0A8X8I8Y2_CALTT|nr:hypothetical protein [Caldalkalibacillus thermarum]QZT33673.1 hypothetical protein HUR95_15825 [Caldalkalibacillus thermarum TA2.A1]
MKQIINLTPHAIRVVGKDGQEIITIPPSGQLARVAMVKTPAEEIPAGNGINIPVNHVTYGDVEGLPDPQPDTIYVASAVVAQAVPHRDDVFVPGDLVRDDSGAVVGCRGLNKTV